MPNLNQGQNYLLDMLILPFYSFIFKKRSEIHLIKES